MPHPYIFLILFLIPSVSGGRFDTCLAEIRSGKWGTTGGMDNWGNPVSNISAATAITYELCTKACGTGPEKFNWFIFSSPFSSWLLPWLALVSQLPFGANNNLQNFTSMLLTIGSPTLAAYSLALTVLNSRWITKRFAAYNYPNSQHAARILINLQQSHLIITKDEHLLASLIVLPENDHWWNELVMRLDYPHTWSIAAATSVAWVAIAYLFTLINAFRGSVDPTIDAHGVGTAWLWLLPIVTGWLQISPRCDSTRLHQALSLTNAAKARVATSISGTSVSTNSVSRRYALAFPSPGVDDLLRCDEQCTVPIYNYSRLFSWSSIANDMCDAFGAASYRASKCIPVNPDIKWEGGCSHRIHDKNRIGTGEQVDAYCTLHTPRGRWQVVKLQCIVEHGPAKIYNVTS